MQRGPGAGDAAVYRPFVISITILCRIEQIAQYWTFVSICPAKGFWTECQLSYTLFTLANQMANFSPTVSVQMEDEVTKVAAPNLPPGTTGLVLRRPLSTISRFG